MHKWLIIGSNSFIGKRLSDYLNEHHGSSILVDGFSRNDSNKCINSWRCFDWPKKRFKFEGIQDYDTIIYCSGAGIQSNRDESNEMIYHLNTFLPIQIIDFLDEHNFAGTFFSFGSYFEIGAELDCRKQYTEEEILFSVNWVPNAYCVSKRLLSRYIYDRRSAINNYHLMLPTIYGHGENNQRLIPYVLSSLNANKEIRLTSGNQIRQYLHIVDLIKLITTIQSSAPTKGIYNISAADTLHIADLVKIILGENESGSVLWGTEKRSDTQMVNLQLNSNKIKKINNQTRPLIDIKEGVLSYYNL